MVWRSVNFLVAELIALIPNTKLQSAYRKNGVTDKKKIKLIVGSLKEKTQPINFQRYWLS